jgi:ABC-type antimicrobial peptide transport system permease subunit
MVIRHALLLALGGLVAGLVLALVASRYLASLLYGIAPVDPVTFMTVALLLMVVAGVAGFIPAWRASRVDPMVALRYQ